MVRESLLAVVLVAAAAGCGSSRSNANPDAGGNGGGAGAGGRGGAVGPSGLGGGGAPGGAGGTGGAVGSGGVGATGAGVAGATGDAGVSGSGGAGGQAGAGGAGGAVGAGGAGGAAGAAGPFYPLDMNDVTILVPLPASNATPVLLRGSDLADDGTALVPRALVDRVGGDADIGGRPILPPQAYERLHLVAVRFDLCDRHLPGPCPEAEDGRLRLVFQPFLDGQGAEDVGFHAFYTIRNDEIAGAVAALRDLARIAPSQSGPLRISPALGAADPAAYATKVRAFVKRYGGAVRIVRLTMNARSRVSAQVQWVLRGVEMKGDAFDDITIVGATAILETVALGGNPSFDVMPVTDTPAGFLDVVRSWIYDAADAATRRELVGALAAVENPLSHTAETVACAGCHVSTVIMKARTASSGIDPLTIPGRYISRFDLSVAGGKSADSTSTIRAFGYLAKDPMISQRVANDTAQTLTEIEHRFPAR